MLRVPSKHGRHVLVERAEDRIAGGLQKRREGQQRHQRRFDPALDRPVDAALDEIAERPQQEHGDQEGREVRHAPLEEDVVDDERAQHVDRPVGEVDDVHHAEHEREPERHQDVDRADATAR